MSRREEASKLNSENIGPVKRIRALEGRGWNGHFLGFWARLNCENRLVIPAWLVRSNFNDPRRIPYLVI
jgi:hypothetical protein